MKLLRLLIICVLMLNVFATPVFAADIDCKNVIETCPPTSDPCLCKSMPPSPVEIEGPAVATAGTVFAAKTGTGRAAYHFSIDAGSINELTGEVTSAPACPQPATVTVTDACDQQDSMTVEIAGDELLISGTETPVVGTQYSASGGSAPYVWSFDGGSIDGAGVITSINDCGAPGEPRWTTVTLADGCGEVKTLEVRLPGGGWALQRTEGTYVSVGDCAYFGQCCMTDFGFNYTAGYRRKVVSGKSLVYEYGRWVSRENNIQTFDIDYQNCSIDIVDNYDEGNMATTPFLSSTGLSCTGVIENGSTCIGSGSSSYCSSTICATKYAASSQEIVITHKKIYDWVCL